MFDQKAIVTIRSVLITRGETIAVAESVTAGYLQAALASAENARQFFQGGITTYNVGQKTKHLNVDPVHALACNSVSKRVADDMAMNVIALFTSDWGIGITGYAAPVPELNITERFAYFCVSFRRRCILTEKIVSQASDPTQAQNEFVNTVLQRLANHLTGTAHA